MVVQSLKIAIGCLSRSIHRVVFCKEGKLVVQLVDMYCMCTMCMLHMDIVAVSLWLVGSFCMGLVLSTSTIWNRVGVE